MRSKRNKINKRTKRINKKSYKKRSYRKSNKSKRAKRVKGPKRKRTRKRQDGGTEFPMAEQRGAEGGRPRRDRYAWGDILKGEKVARMEVEVAPPAVAATTDELRDSHAESFTAQAKGQGGMPRAWNWPDRIEASDVSVEVGAKTVKPAPGATVEAEDLFGKVTVTVPDQPESGWGELGKMLEQSVEAKGAPPPQFPGRRIRGGYTDEEAAAAAAARSTLAQAAMLRQAQEERGLVMNRGAEISKKQHEIKQLYEEYISKKSPPVGDLREQSWLNQQTDYRSTDLAEIARKGAKRFTEEDFGMLDEIIKLIKSNTPDDPEMGSKIYNEQREQRELALASVKGGWLSSAFEPISLSPTGTSPEQYRSQTNWVPDTKSDRCMRCSALFVRGWGKTGKHHCRGCGILVCDNCSKNTLALKYIQTRRCEIEENTGEVRVCLDCFTFCETNLDCAAEGQSHILSHYCKDTKQIGGYRKSNRKTYKKRSYRKSKKSKRSSRKTRRSFLKKTRAKATRAKAKEKKNKRMIGGSAKVLADRLSLAGRDDLPRGELDPEVVGLDSLREEQATLTRAEEAKEAVAGTAGTATRAARETGEISPINFSIRTIKKLLEQHDFPIGKCESDKCLREFMKDFLTKFPTNSELKNLEDLHGEMGYIKANKYYKMAETQNPGNGKEDLQTAAFQLYHADEEKIDHLLQLLGHDITDINDINLRGMALATIENANGDIRAAFQAAFKN